MNQGRILHFSVSRLDQTTRGEMGAAYPSLGKGRRKCRILDLGTMVANATRLASVFCRFTRRRSRFHAQLLQGADPHEEV